MKKYVVFAKKKSDQSRGGAATRHGFDPSQPRAGDGRWKEAGGTPKDASGDTDVGYFDAKSGRVGDAKLITSQSFRDDGIVQSKIDEGDFDVYVSPEFEIGGERVRVVLDGHHSLSAATISGSTPNFTEWSPSDHDAIGLLDGGDAAGFLEAVYMDSDYHNAITGSSVWNTSAINSGNGERKIMAQVRVNIRSLANVAAVRKEKRNGRDLLIVPSATLPDGVVMNGIRYPADEIAKSFTSLNRTPAPLGHPMVNGQFVSASDPEGINVGYIGAWNENARQENGRVFLDKVIDIEFAGRSEGGKAVLAAINAGDPVHTSTGLLCELDACNDGTATHTARNIMFDHDAILIGEEGAATPDQGVGMLVNGKQIQVINSSIDYDDEQLDWAGMHLLDAFERAEKRGRWKELKAALLRVIMPERETKEKETEMTDAEKQQLDGLSAQINSVADAVKALTEGFPAMVANAVKPLTDDLTALQNAAKATETAELEGHRAAIVKANIMNEAAAGELTLNAARALAPKAAAGTAAGLNGAFTTNAADEFKDYDLNAMMEAK